MSAHPPPRHRALESRDPVEWEGTEPLPPAQRQRSATVAMIVALLVLVGIVALVVLI